MTVFRELPNFAQKTAAQEKENIDLDFLNFSFDKGRLKSIVSWFFENYGQYKTLQLLDKLKMFGFGYATLGGLSLGIDDLKIPDQKISLMATAETKVAKDLAYFRNAKITGIERMQRLIYTWNQTNDTLKQEVVKYFETKDLFNPIYMMAFSGARGNMSQVRQLVGMRGLMSDPQGQIIDFPIQSNFREGLTLTEYLISTYGARKGIVDTALRTATAGYLTRRLVDVAQHVIVSRFDCGTMRGIYVFDMKEANKTIYSFQNRLIGRILAQDIFSVQNKDGKIEKQKIASRNQQIDQKFAAIIAKVTKKAFVRSPLTCETPRLLCQLCYGWSLSQGKLVSVGEAVGVIAAQSIGEPGTQLTMRTFHTGGVFAGGLTDQILAPFDGKIQFVESIPGTCIRTSLSETAFLTKIPGSFFVQKKASCGFSVNTFHSFESENQFKFSGEKLCRANKLLSNGLPTLLSSFKNKDYMLVFGTQRTAFSSIQKKRESVEKQRKKNQPYENSIFSEFYKIPAYAILFVRNHEFVQKKQLLAQFSTVEKKQLQYGSAEQTLFSNCAGEFYLSNSNIPFSKKEKFQKINLLLEKRSNTNSESSKIEFQSDIIWRTKNWANVWLLSGKMIYNSFGNPPILKNNIFQKGDFITQTSVWKKILWKKPKNFELQIWNTKNTSAPIYNMFYLLAIEDFQNSCFSYVSSSFFFQKTSVFSSKKGKKQSQSVFFHPSFHTQQNGFIPPSDFSSTFKQKKGFDFSFNREKFCTHMFESFLYSLTKKQNKNILKNSSLFFPGFFTNIGKKVNRNTQHFPIFLFLNNTQIVNSLKTIHIQKNMWKNFPFFSSSFQFQNMHGFSFSLFFHKAHKNRENFSIAYGVFQPFLRNKYKTKNQKFLKWKNNILFSQNFRHIFFSSGSKTNRFSGRFAVSANLLKSSAQREKKKLKKSIVSFLPFFSRKSLFIQDEKTPFIFEKHSALLKPSKVFSSNENIYSSQKICFPNFKHQFKRMFLKFSTLGSLPSFHIKKYEKIFSLAQNIQCKLSSQSFTSCTKVISLSSAVFTNSWKSLWYLGNFPFKISFHGNFLKKQNISSFHFLTTNQKYNQNFFFKQKFLNVFAKKMKGDQRKKQISFFSQGCQKKSGNGVFQYSKTSFILSSLIFKNINMFCQKKSFFNMELKHAFEENSKNFSKISKNLFFKKSLYSFHFEKIRYNDFGYTFSCVARSKENNVYFENPREGWQFFRIFSKLKPSVMDDTQLRNPGKEEKGISVGNAYFFGKDLTNIFSYCFPKDFETVTNGIFLLGSFHQISKKQKFSQFLCTKRKKGDFFSFNYFAKIMPISIFSKYHQQPNLLKSFDFNTKIEFHSKSHSMNNSFLDNTNPNNQKMDSSESVSKKMNPSKNCFLFSSFETKNSHSKTKNTKKLSSVSVSKNVSFVILNTFSFLQNSRVFSFSEKQSISNGFFQSQKNKSFQITRKYSSQKIVTYNFSEKMVKNNQTFFFLGGKPLKSDSILFFQSSDLNIGQKPSKLSKTFFPSHDVLQSEYYTNEIFWLPQENYVFSNLQLSSFSFLPCKNGLLKTTKHNKFTWNQKFDSMDRHKQIQNNSFEKERNKKKHIFSKMCFQNVPLFYFSNKQGKKMPFFSKLDGISHSFLFSNTRKSSKFPNFGGVLKRKRRNPYENFEWLQEKICFYNRKNEKILKNKKTYQKKNELFLFQSPSNNGKNHLREIPIEKANFLTDSSRVTVFPQNVQKSVNQNSNVSEFFPFENHRKSLVSVFQTKTNVQSKTQKYLFSQKKYKTKAFAKNISVNNQFPNLAFQFATKHKKYKKQSFLNFVHMQSFLRKEFQKKSSSFKKQKGFLKALQKKTPQKNTLFSIPNSFQKSCFRKNSHKNFQEKFSFAFFKKIQKSNFQTIQKLFDWKQKSVQIGKTNNFVFFPQNTKKKVHISKFVSNQCFTVLPFKTLQRKRANPFSNCKNHTILNNKEIQSHPSRKIKKTKVPCFETQKVYVKVQSGWFYSFPNISNNYFSSSHQTQFNPGHFFQKNICFEQNRIYCETLVSEKGTVGLNKSFYLQNEFIHNMQKPFFKEQHRKKYQIALCTPTNTQQFQKFSCVFSIETVVQNKHSRFLNKGSFYAMQNFIKNEKNLCIQPKKVFALFLRPFQYRMLENPKNSKKIFQSRTIQNLLPTFAHQNSLLQSSKKLYQSYHSNISNLQKPEKIFLQNIGDDSQICSEFEQINFFPSRFSNLSLLKFQNFSQDKKTFQKKLQKYEFVNEYGAHPTEKKEKNQKFFLFQQNSKKNSFKKFQSLILRKMEKNCETDQNFLSSSPKFFVANQKKKTYFQNFFFSFYPVQFSPLKISNFSKLSDTSEFTPKIPSVFVNSIQNTIDFSLCEKKATFLNQRLLSVDFIEKEKKFFSNNSSFWLNKEKTNFVFLKKTSKSIWKNSSIEKNSGRFFAHGSVANGFNDYSRNGFQNFFFQNNPHFFANSQFFSPFEGELISVFTNETNWWKKASEISTLQKIDTLFSVITKKDLFSVDFSHYSLFSDDFLNSILFFQKNNSPLSLRKHSEKKTKHSLNKTYLVNGKNSNRSLQSEQAREAREFCPKIFIHQKIRKNKKQKNLCFVGQKNEKSLSFSPSLVNTKQKHLFSLYDSIAQNHKKFSAVTESFLQSAVEKNSIETSSFVTKYEKKLYMLKNFNIGYSKYSKKPVLGKFLVYGDCLFNSVLSKPGQIIHVSAFKVTFRRAQPFFVSPKGILHFSITPYIEKNIAIVTLPYQTVQSGDIVQGIPKVEQFFEARTTVQGRLFVSSLPILLKGIFQRYKALLPLEQAVRQSFLKIQQLIVDGVQRVYRSQGVGIIDKHLEVVVRQMTTKVQIVHGGQTGFFPGELVNLEFVERMNKFLMVKIRYEPVILGITRASLEVESFLSASSFQQTTKILALASISRKKDFLKGLKENLLVGNLIPSGTGYMMLYKNF